MTHNRMANTMADADTMSNPNTMADSNTMANANTMAYSNSVSDPSKELRGGRCSSCQGRNDQRSLQILWLIQSDQMTEI